MNPTTPRRNSAPTTATRSAGKGNIPALRTPSQDTAGTASAWDAQAPPHVPSNAAVESLVARSDLGVSAKAVYLASVLLVVHDLGGASALTADEADRLLARFPERPTALEDLTVAGLWRWDGDTRTYLVAQL